MALAQICILDEEQAAEFAYLCVKA